MRNAQGYNIVTSPGERSIEHDTITCAHCQWVGLTKGVNSHLQVMVMANDGKTFRYVDAGFCMKCMRPTCPRPACRLECVPIEAKVEAEEKLARMILSAGA